MDIWDSDDFPKFLQVDSSLFLTLLENLEFGPAAQSLRQQACQKGTTIREFKIYYEKFLRTAFLIHGSNNRKAIKENTKPNSQKALGSLTSTVVDVGAQSAIHTSQPESSNVSLGAGYVTTWHILNTSMKSKMEIIFGFSDQKLFKNHLEPVEYRRNY